MEYILPERVSPWIQYARYLDQIEQDPSYYYNRAFALLDSEKKGYPGWFKSFYKFYVEQEQPEKAYEALKKGIVFLPDYPYFYYWLGVDATNRKNFTEAEKYYQKAVLLSPNNKDFRIKLQETEKELAFQQ